jgi:integrase
VNGCKTPSLKVLVGLAEGSLMYDGNIITQYANYQRLRGWAETTIRRRTVTLSMLERLAAPGDLTTVTGDTVVEFLAGYRSPRTRHSYRSDLRAFYTWAIRRNLVAADPTELIDSVKVPKSLPRPINSAMVPAIIAAAADDDTRLMVALAVYAGLRRAEIAALDAGNVSDRALVVRDGKGGKDRTVPLHPALAKMLEGKRGPLFDVSPDTVGRRIKDHLRACGVTATAHQLRHTFGTELARITGGDLLMIGQLMGHASATTTMGYTQLGGDKGAAAVSHLFGDAA